MFFSLASGLYLGFGAHEAGSDVPMVIRIHSAAADLSPSLVSTAAEAHPVRSPCAFAEAVGQWHLIRLSHITGKKIAHGRLSFCASFVSVSYYTRRSGCSVMDSRLSWHRRAVSVCATFQNWWLTNVLFYGKGGRFRGNRPPAVVPMPSSSAYLKQKIRLERSDGSSFPGFWMPPEGGIHILFKFRRNQSC